MHTATIDNAIACDGNSFFPRMRALRAKRGAEVKRLELRWSRGKDSDGKTRVGYKCFMFEASLFWLPWLFMWFHRPAVVSIPFPPSIPCVVTGRPPGQCIKSC